jgi:hypothetical protein
MDCIDVTLEEPRPQILFGRGVEESYANLPRDAGKKKVPEPELDYYAVDDRVRVNLHTGRIVDATVKAVIERRDGKRLQVDFGKDETALVYLWQVHRL